MFTHQFWKNQRFNPNNPTFSSAQVFNSLTIEPYAKTQFSKYQRNQNSIIRSKLLNSEIKSESQLNRDKVELLLPKIQQSNRNINREKLQIPVKNQRIHNNSQHNNKIQSNFNKNYSKSTTNLNLAQSDNFSGNNNVSSFSYSKYGLNKNMYNSAFQVYQKQNSAYDYDIIKNTPKKYKSSLNIFPKYRLQRLDNDYKTRQAFIKGDMQKLKEIKIKQNDKKMIESNMFKSSMINQKINKIIDKKMTKISFLDLKKPQPIQIAFKITQNPQIKNKKIILEK